MSKTAAMETSTPALPPDYAGWLSSLKQRIQSAQQRAALAVNRELMLLYRQIGRDILARQQAQGWGARVIDRLARDLSAAFPGMKGFSPRNLKYMRRLRKLGRRRQLCSRLLHNCRGFTYASCSTR